MYFEMHLKERTKSKHSTTIESETQDRRMILYKTSYAIGREKSDFGRREGFLHVKGTDRPLENVSIDNHILFGKEYKNRERSP